MKQETFDLIHRNYNLAAEQSNNILEIVKNLYKLLSECDVCTEDSLQFDAFLNSLERAIKKREKTFHFPAQCRGEDGISPAVSSSPRARKAVGVRPV